jgi:F-type H+-transporting ATPase subunit b
MLDVGLGLFVWNLIAFLVVLLLLRKFAWKPILNSLNERETKIADSIATADRVKAEMAQLQSENEALMAKAREERAALLKEAKATGDRLINDAKERAKAEANKIVAEAQLAINNQKKAALTEVKNEVGNLVIDVAEKILRRELANKAEQEAYISQLSQQTPLN